MSSQSINFLGGWINYLTTINGYDEHGTVALHGSSTHWHLIINISNHYGSSQLGKFEIRAIEIGCSRIMADMNLSENHEPDSTRGRRLKPRLNLCFGEHSRTGFTVPQPESFLLTILTQAHICTVRFSHIDWEGLRLASRQFPAPADLRVFCEPVAQPNIEGPWPLQSDKQADILSYVMANRTLTSYLLKTRQWRPTYSSTEYHLPERWGQQAIVHIEHTQRLLSRVGKSALRAEINRISQEKVWYQTRIGDKKYVETRAVIVNQGQHPETGLHWAIMEYSERHLPKVRTPGQLTIPALYLSLKKSNAQIINCEIGWFDRNALAFTAAKGPAVPRYDEAWFNLRFVLPNDWAESSTEVWEAGEYQLISDENVFYKLPKTLLRKRIFKIYQRQMEVDQMYDEALSAGDGPDYVTACLEAEDAYFQLRAEEEKGFVSN